MIKSKKLFKFKSINHGFFNKFGGTSLGIYKSLNCGIGSSDKKENIKKNIKIVAKKIGTSYRKVILPNQIHSNKFYFINKFFSHKKKIKADALITNQKKIAIGILTADCVPILIYDNKKKIVSAIHAGWKGAYRGIIDNVLKFLIKNGSDPKNLNVAIGPCITKKNYEVKNEFKRKFLKKDRQNKKFFYFNKKKTYFSLNAYVYSQLTKHGIKNIEIINKNTFDIKNNFFSARRSIHNKDGDYGRNISIIMIN